MSKAETTSALTVDALSGWYPDLSAAPHCYIAYSGGLDSHVLLHLLANLLPASKITALHINHQLSPNSVRWAQHCSAVCEALAIDCRVETVSVLPDGEGIEAAARKARYTVFRSHLEKGDFLLQAHHANDQVETLLYRLLRGSDISGLAGIPQQRRLGEGTLLRPLLSYTRTQIEDYAIRNGLQWVEDESNADSRFDRNFIRNELLPLISHRWPDYQQRLAHTAALAGEAALLNRMLAGDDLSCMNPKTERYGWSLAVKPLTELPQVRAVNLVRHWIAGHDLPQPGHKMMATLMHEFLLARPDAQPLLEWPGAELRRYRDRLYLMPPRPDNQTQSVRSVSLNFDPQQPLQLPDGSTLTAQPALGEGLYLQGFPEKVPRLQVGFRQGGERCQPAGRGKSNTLKKLLQEYNLEPWMRDWVPLVYRGDELVAVGDLWVCEGYAAKPGQRGLVLSHTY